VSKRAKHILRVRSRVKNTEERHMTSRHDWRAWLQENHDTKKEVWLTFYKKHTRKPNISYDEAVEEALCFGWIDSIIKKIDDEKFVRKFTPRKPGSKWSESNKKRASKMINEGKMTEAGMALISQAKERGIWQEKSQPERDFTIPRYVETALKSNEKALENFNKLAKSYKKQYIGWVDSAKKEETRKRRLAEVINLLERNKRLGMK